MSGKEFVEHQVHDHAGHRDIHPDGVSPAGNAAMGFKLPPESERERDHNKRHDNGGKDRVRNQNREIDWTRPSVAAKMNRADVGVVIEIKAEKQAGRDERRDHRRAVLQDLSALDELVPNGQQHGGEAVQSGVDWGKDAVVDLHEEWRTRSSQR